jgi:hypothetical protein
MHLLQGKLPGGTSSVMLLYTERAVESFTMERWASYEAIEQFN